MIQTILFCGTIDPALGSVGILLIAEIVVVFFLVAAYFANREPRDKTNKKVKQNRSWLVNFIGEERFLVDNSSNTTSTNNKSHKKPSVVVKITNNNTPPSQTNSNLAVSNSTTNNTATSSVETQKPKYVPKPIPKPAPKPVQQKPPVVKERPINIELFKNTNINYKKYKNDKIFFDDVISAYKNLSQNHKRVYKTPKDLLNFICYYCNINLEDYLFKKDNKNLDAKTLFTNTINELSKHLYINYKNLSLNNRVLLLSDFGQIKRFDNYNDMYNVLECILCFYDASKISFDEIVKQFDEFVDEVWEKSKAKDNFVNKLQYQ